jgi:hypothetical protein
MAILLLLSANPLDSDHLRVDEELRDIRERIAAVPGNGIQVEVRLAIRPQDLQSTLLQINPEIVHFTGHGNENGELVLENPNGYAESVSPEALADLFRLFRGTVRCVVLNACDSSEQARMLSQFLDCAIGMEGEISDGAGKAFSVAFYQALAYGKDVATAFELGRNQIHLEDSNGLGDENIPRLYVRDNVESISLIEISTQKIHSRLGAEAIVQAQISAATVALGMVKPLTLTLASYDAEPPPTAEKCSKRKTTLDRVQADLGERKWYAVHGGIGTGKTNLAVLLARRRQGRCMWLRLRDRTPLEAVAIVDSTFTQIKRRPFGQTKAEWYKECFHSLGADSVLVLDDLPRTTGREELDDCLVFLSAATRESDTLLITTGATPISTVIRAAVGDRLIETAIPAFDESEIRELLEAHGATDRFLTQAWVNTVSLLCRQHPLLLTEAARFLESRGWKTDAQTFQDVMSGQYAINLDAPTQQDLQRTIPDPETRELLYRLRIVGGPFSDMDVRGLAAIPKAVDHSAERLTNLLGLWVQRDSQNRYVISPLISRLSDSNLSIETAKTAHGYLASRLTGESRMTPTIVMQAIHHLISADLCEKAGMLLLSALQAFLRVEKPKDDVLLSDVWAHSPLPLQISFSLRVCIRATQIAVYEQKKKDCSFLLTDLEELLASDKFPKELESLEVLVAGTLGTALWSSRPLDATRYAIRGLHYLRTAPNKIAGVRTRRIRAGFFEMLWSTLCTISSDGDLMKWLAHVDTLSAEDLIFLTRAKLADTGSEIGCNEIWLREHRKPPDEHDWVRALEVLASVRDWAQTRGVPVLYARAQWGTVVVLAEYLDRFEDAIAVGRDAIARCSADLKAVFWLEDIVGRQYYYKQRWKESLEWLVRCSDSSARVDPSKRANTTCLAGVVAARLNRTEAVVLLARAAEVVADHVKDIPHVEASSIYGELAIERWRRGERSEAFKEWSRAADCLLDVSNPDDEWKIKIPIFGNCSGYFAYVTQHGNDAAWESARPDSGVMIDRHEGVLGLFDAKKLFAIAAQMVLLAEGLGLYDESLAWAARTSLADFTPELGSLIVPYRTAAHVNEKKFVQAVEEAWNCYASGATAIAEGNEKHGDFSQHTGRIALVIVAFGIARVRVNESIEAARRVFTEIESRIQSLSHEQLDEFWLSALAALRAIVGDEQNWKALYETGMRLGEEGQTMPDIMYRLAAVMAAAPREAFNLTIYSFLRSLIPWMMESPYWAVVVPFIRDYWIWSSQTYGIHFSLPARTRQELREAFASDGEAGLKLGLRLIAERLGITLSEKHKQYLYQGL